MSALWQQDLHKQGRIAVIMIATVGWERLGDTIVTERARRWRSRAAFAKAAGISTRVLDDLENGARTNYLDSTLAAVEATLGWSPGTCRRLVAGGTIRRDMDSDLVRLMDIWPYLSKDARALLVDMAERARRD